MPPPTHPYKDATVLSPSGVREQMWTGCATSYVNSFHPGWKLNRSFWIWYFSDSSLNRPVSDRLVPNLWRGEPLLVCSRCSECNTMCSWKHVGCVLRSETEPWEIWMFFPIRWRAEKDQDQLCSLSALPHAPLKFKECKFPQKLRHKRTRTHTRTHTYTYMHAIFSVLLFSVFFCDTTLITEEWDEGWVLSVSKYYQLLALAS